MPQAFPFLSKEQYDRLSQAEKLGYLDRAIDAWQKLEAAAEATRSHSDPLPGPERVTSVARARRS
jgi:hypothetical protein